YNGSSRNLQPDMLLRPFLSGGFTKLMSESQPDVVISVLPVVNGLLTHAAKAANARTDVVLTDWHSVHPFWVARGVDHYTASTESSRRDCIKFGAPPEAVDVVGIPVRREFSVPLASAGPSSQRCTVLAMVGAEGSPRALANITRLAAANIDARFVVVCGRNAELRRQLERT